jgi:hypothetical protein
VSWSKCFYDPIVLSDGKLATLRRAIGHLGTIPKSDHDMPSVTTAAECLTLAAEHGAPIEFARIATLQASTGKVSVNLPSARIRTGAGRNCGGTNRR